MKDYQSVTEVIKELKPTYPDLNQAKIRLFESEGLLNPEVTDKGSRRYYPHDVNRLELILKLQTNHDFSFDVIRERLRLFDKGVYAGEPDDTTLSEDILSQNTYFTTQKICEAYDVDYFFLSSLNTFGLIEIDHSGSIDMVEADYLPVISAARELAQMGIEPRHLRVYAQNMQKEANLLTSLLSSSAIKAYRSRSETDMKALDDTLETIKEPTQVIKDLLLKHYLKENLKLILK